MQQDDATDAHAPAAVTAGSGGDAEAELAAIREERQAARRRPYRRSRLTRYRAELVELRRAGGTLAELQAWLRQRRIKVHRSTIARFLDRLPEMADA